MMEAAKVYTERKSKRAAYKMRKKQQRDANNESSTDIKNPEHVKWETEFVTHKYIPEPKKNTTFSLPKLFTDKSIRFGQVVDTTNRNRAVLFLRVVPRVLFLGESTKAYAGFGSVFLGTWRRYCKHLFTTGDSKKLVSSDLEADVVNDLGPLLGFLQNFLKKNLPVLYHHHLRLRKLLQKHKEIVKQDVASFATKTDLSSSQLGILEDSFLGIFNLVCIGHKSGRSMDFHRDVNNLAFGYNIVLPFGEFEGGAMQFPGMNFEVDVLPGDILVFDAEFYQHCLSQVNGNRYSVIVFGCKNAGDELYGENGLDEAKLVSGTNVTDDWFAKEGLVRYFNPMEGRNKEG
ncbi:hypothetical protein BCR33DRAFT_861891 [Rhizoclosmatium globosum]|uniref:Fe2OG dioxygenase domain-containing protein n=1 Tax=Rhizoclosmatium globosum TaxID=329046 RepID=A0A1Y2AGG3_9FUNG|nr:hypothetical protein BCR33DRAFT_861891 [Rhizoclosmatium globosum]|eukprot:ORY21683.1 hypothetical protein BCR33DRAFT_861891 [Rhizoclosmatium globosum]